MSNDIRNLLNIKDPNIHFEENCVQREEQAIQIHCTLTYPLEQCPHCQDYHSIVCNGTRSSRITYLDTAGQACYLIMKKQRYRCKTCYHPRLSNGPIEGINNKIKVLKRNAYGYRNYSHFRHRILLIARLYVSGRNKEGTKQVLAA